MNKRRLLKMAELLEADAANKNGIKFDIRSWVKPGNSRRSTFRSKNPKVSVSCGTSACAMGLAAISGAFKRSGLSYKVQESLFFEGYEIIPICNGHGGYEAAASLFEIDYHDATYLFSPESYSVFTGARAELTVAKRIRKLVSDHQS